LTFQDELSKYTLAIPIKQQDAQTIARVFVEVILKCGIPQMVLTVRGSNFMSEILTNICKLLKIKKIKCTAYHPQSNGALERTHRVLVEYLLCFILEDQSDWVKWLPYATFMFNMTPHTATGYHPHEILFGRKPNIPGMLQREPPGR
jgi:transposase InsO family protein